MKKHIFLVAALVAGLASAVAQTKLIETVEAKPGSLDISYKKYQLSNGLTLIVHEDHSDPVVHLNVTYHVGSAREMPGRSGFAHFFEHMLFQGSKNVADEEHFKLIARYGGDVNGNTTRDRTSYVETFPSNFTETALWMEADRMGVFLEAFTQKKFEVQRSTVKNEKDQRYSGPYGFLNEVKEQLLYPKEHPYSWPVIGYVDDLDRADSNDMKKFFLRWYGPNNAAVIVSGDVSSDQVLAWVEKYFGTIQPGPSVNKQFAKPVVLTKNEYRTYPDYNAFLPLFNISYPGVPVGHKDEAALDLLSYLMSNGRQSALYKKFVEPEWALQAQASNNPNGTINHELAGNFDFVIVGYPFSDISKLQKKLEEVIDSFEFTNFSDADFENAKTNILSSYSSGLEDVSTKAYYLSNFWYLFDNKSNLQADYDRIKNVTRQDVMNAFKKYIKGKYFVCITMQPKEVPPGEKKQKYVSVNPNAGVKDPVREAELAVLVPRPPKDNFDRSKRPEPGEPKSVAAPKIFRKTLGNGLEILGTTTKETPRVSIQMNLKGGHLLDDNKTIPAGTGSFTATMMNIGTAKRTPEELDAALEKIGASIGFGSGTTSTNISLECEASNLDQALAILDEMLFQPRWDEKEFKKAKKNAGYNITNSLRNRGTGARNAWRRLMYDGTALGDYIGENEINKITISACKNYYEKFYAPEITKLVVVGPLNSEEVYGKLKFLEKWQKKNVTVPTPVVNYDVTKPHIFGVEYIDAEQSDIMVGFKSLPYDVSGEFFKNNIMNFTLGGAFNSRLNLNLREDKAWTYGIRGGFSPAYENVDGYYLASASVKAQATDSAIEQTVAELKKFKENGMTKEEFDFTKQALLASEALNYESNGQKAGYILGIALRNLPENYSEQQTEALKKVTIEELNALAKKNINTDRLVIVVAGDMLLLKDRLNKLGYGKVQMLEKTGQGKVKLEKGETKHKKNY